MASQIVDEILTIGNVREFKNNSVIVVTVPPEVANKLKGRMWEIDAWALAKGFKLMVYWQGCQGIPYIFDGKYAAATTPPTDTLQEDLKERLILAAGEIYTAYAKIPAELLQYAVKAMESDRPISIVNQDTRQQILINQPMEELLATPADRACTRIMTNFWRPSDLAELDRKYQQMGDVGFEWDYQGGLNESTWAKLAARFKKFTASDGHTYGFVVNLDAEPMPYPEDMLSHV